MFRDEKALAERRLGVHDRYVDRESSRDGKDAEWYLSGDEAEALRVAYERKLVEFCAKFVPPMPKAVLGTAVQYFKRFYINNSVMDYHPKEIL